MPPLRELYIQWKITLPAELAGRIEYALMDSLAARPIYGARARLIQALLEHWLAQQRGDPNPPTVPSINDLRTRTQ